MFSSNEAKFVRTISELVTCNPFLSRRIELEKKALGSDFQTEHARWNLDPSQLRDTPNLQLIYERSRALVARVAGTSPPDDRTLEMYFDLARMVIFNEYEEAFEEMVRDGGKSAGPVYRRFRKDWLRYCPPETVPEAVTNQIPHIFGLLFQIRRAFNNIFRNIIGSCQATIELRADVWRSIFTHDFRRYGNSLYRSMADFPTLITGPTGSGKELVAQAIGLSGYVPFDEQSSSWDTPLDSLFTSLNLSALSPTIIETELFGHKKGAFTGAVADRVGWLETCPRHGAVFLDEIGELSPEIQVKLLRVFEDRLFQRLGDTDPRVFHGRIIAATNRDLEAQITNNQFRSDFYYRLCADRVKTPSLFQRCREDSSELTHLVKHLMLRITSEVSQAETLAAECVDWIGRSLSDHTWPGNVRELDQCVRSWLLRKEYEPLGSVLPVSADLHKHLASLDLSADELVSLYCQVKYEQHQSYSATAEALGLDRRTVKSRVTTEA